MRMTPPSLQTSALTEFDNEVKDVFSRVTGVMADNEQWKQTTGSLAKAGWANAAPAATPLPPSSLRLARQARAATAWTPTTVSEPQNKVPT